MRLPGDWAFCGNAFCCGPAEEKGGGAWRYSFLLRASDTALRRAWFNGSKKKKTSTIRASFPKAQSKSKGQSYVKAHAKYQHKVGWQPHFAVTMCKECKNAAEPEVTPSVQWYVCGLLLGLQPCIWAVPSHLTRRTGANIQSNTDNSHCPSVFWLPAINRYLIFWTVSIKFRMEKIHTLVKESRCLDRSPWSASLSYTHFLGLFLVL